jgi:hypothetical protein
MGKYIRDYYFSWRFVLASIFTLPWEHMVIKRGNESVPVPKGYQLYIWISNWVVTLAGITGTGIFMPYLVLAWHVPLDYQSWVEIGGSFVGGVVWQLGAILLTYAVILPWNVVTRLFRSLSYALMFPGNVVTRLIGSLSRNVVRYDEVIAIIAAFFCGSVIPLGATAYLIYWYFSNFAPHHNLVGTGIIGASLLKIFISVVLPLIKTLVPGQVLRWVLRKIRGEPPERTKGTPLP